MANKQQIQAIKENNERTIQGLRTGFREFTYDETGGYVKPDKLYSVYYTLTKKQVYLTGTEGTYNSKIINKVVENINKTLPKIHSERPPYDIAVEKISEYL